MEEISGSPASQVDPSQLISSINTVVAAASAFAGFATFISHIQAAIDAKVNSIEAASVAASEDLAHRAGISSDMPFGE